MSTTVVYTGKDGKDYKATFGTPQLAAMYAKTVRNPRFEDSSTEAPVVEVKRCPVATADVQKAATNAYFRAVKEPKNGRVIHVEDRSEEQNFELMSEHFGAARAAGQSMSDACSDWDFIQGR